MLGLAIAAAVYSLGQQTYYLSRASFAHAQAYCWSRWFEKGSIKPKAALQRLDREPKTRYERRGPPGAVLDGGEYLSQGIDDPV